MSVQAVTINKVCLSGMNAIMIADQMIRAGHVKVVVVDGMESMARAPHTLPGSRAGYRYGDVTMLDHLEYDALHDVFTDAPMGIFTEEVDRAPVSRLDQDLIEINEALAAVGPASERELGVDGEKINVNGGAIAMCHPVGMTGCCITQHLALELQRRGGGRGAAALCGGSGQGDAILITVPKASS